MDLIELITEDITLGKLAPGSKLKEEALSALYGVSRTPLRQALFQLSREEIIEYQVNKGFYIKSLSKNEVRQCYPIIAHLEKMALDISWDLLRCQVDTLRGINEKFEKNKNRLKKALKYDGLFHHQIVQNCGNTVLKEMIQKLKVRMGRYDATFFSSAELCNLSFSQHKLIIDALVENDKAKGLESLQLNWDCGLQFFENSLCPE